MKDEYEHMFFGRNIYFAPVFCRIVRKSSDLNLLLRVRINSIPNFFFFFLAYYTMYLYLRTELFLHIIVLVAFFFFEQAVMIMLVAVLILY